MNVSACLVTRGDVDLESIIESLPKSWEILIWDNSGTIVRSDGWLEVVADLAVYGRYAAIEYASHDLIYVADDDVIVSDPQAIVDEWKRVWRKGVQGKDGLIQYHFAPDQHVVCNMPQEFRPHYPDSGLVGFGAAFHRDAPAKAFEKLGFSGTCSPFIEDEWWDYKHTSNGVTIEISDSTLLRRRADNVFTTLTPRVLVDVPKTDREFASDPNRMWRQPGHEGEKQRMIELARQVRDSV